MAVHYKLKEITFLGRDVPVVIQNENGPCPLIALANVLLLRNQIKLSVDCPEVSQERLLALIAGFLLDSNNPERLAASDAEMQANLQKNMGDAVEMLPKLTTGLDVNIVYHDIRGFEFTDVVAIFDLLDIQLVHGWLVDPQDKDTVACIGNMSYNALIERLVTLTGPAAADSATAPGANATATPASNSSLAPGSESGPEEPADSSMQAETTPAADTAAEAAPMEASATAQGTPAQQDTDMLGAEYDSELQAALHLSMSQAAPTPTTEPQQAQPMAVDEPLQLAAAPAATAAPPQPAGPGSSEAPNAAGDGAPLVEDYVVISHPEGAAVDADMAEQIPREQPQDAATGPAYEPPCKTAPAADEGDKVGSSQAPVSSEPVQPLEAIDSEGRVVGAATSQQAPELAQIAAAMLAGSGRGALAAPTSNNKAEATSGVGPETPSDSAPVVAGIAAASDGSAAPEQAAPAGGVAGRQVALAEGSVPERAPPAAESSGAGGQPREAYVIQAFLDNTSSQLTEHGLVSLHAGLQPNQLAVLFRNNHFNTLFKYGNSLYVLVTDLGYLHEKDVVWEKLDAIDGDTVFVTSNLKPPEPVDARATAEQASADYALALQLHQEEQEAAERQRAAAAAADAAGRPGDAPQPPARSGQLGQPLPAQQDTTGGWRRGGNRHHGRHHRPPHSGARPSRPKQDNCSIM